MLVLVLVLVLLVLLVLLSLSFLAVPAAWMTGWVAGRLYTVLLLP